MKISFAAMVGCVAAGNWFADSHLLHPRVQSGFFKKETAEEKAAKQKENTLWYAEGIKEYYTGFYKSFYKQDLPEGSAECLNEETLDNILTFQGMMANPLQAFGTVADIQKDFNMFAQMAQIMENLSVCHYEKPAFDLLALCTKDKKACSMQAVTQNMSKDMFVLIGKMTSLAEVMQDFPSKDRLDFGEQMRELGATGGSWARVMFGYHHPGEKTEHHYHHHSDYDY